LPAIQGAQTGQSALPQLPVGKMKVMIIFIDMGECFKYKTTSNFNVDMALP